MQAQNDRLEALYKAMHYLIAAKNAGHRCEQELNKVIAAVMKELGL